MVESNSGHSYELQRIREDRIGRWMGTNQNQRLASPLQTSIEERHNNDSEPSWRHTQTNHQVCPQTGKDRGIT